MSKIAKNHEISTGPSVSYPAPLHSEICICVYVCVRLHVYTYYYVCESVFAFSLGVLTCAGQRPYREPLWRSLPCSKVALSLPPALSLSLSTSLAPLLPPSLHICPYLYLCSIHSFYVSFSLTRTHTGKHTQLYSDKKHMLCELIF